MGILFCTYGYETVFFHLSTIVLGYFYVTLNEWLIHKYILHGLGKKKDSWFSFHWHNHHKKCRKNNNFDTNYKFIFSSVAVKKEIAGLSILLLIHLPFLAFIPLFYLTLLFMAYRYFYVHRKSHLEPSWAKKNIPWHYDHHMGKNQDSNWGVTTDFWDIVINTRIKYLRSEEDE